MAEAFQEARRELTSLLAPVEKRALLALASRMPRGVNSDHLTALGFAAAALAGAAYALSALDPRFLHLVNLALVLNWFGDSLDGTLARYRDRCRPRYGFYVDHILDAFGALLILGGLAISGLMSPFVALSLLVAYYLLSINIYLATYSLGVFKISYGPLGGTELRLLLAALNLVVLGSPSVPLLGLEILIFDAVATLATVGILTLAVWLTIRNTVTLYRAEPLEPMP
jgi:hypothetical protein